jgi:hypothetical protein
MADFVYNIAKGRAGELVNRVKVGDPAAARLYIIPVDVAAVTDATLRDLDDFAAIITAGVTERSASNWNRKTIAAADIAAITPDDTNDRFDYDIVTDPLWSPGPTAGNSTDLIVCYASVATPTNAQLLPLTQHDFAITADGSDVQGTIAATGFFRST